MERDGGENKREGGREVEKVRGGQEIEIDIEGLDSES